LENLISVSTKPAAGQLPETYESQTSAVPEALFAIPPSPAPL
jgi:hypothetical protein